MGCVFQPLQRSKTELRLNGPQRHRTAGEGLFPESTFVVRKLLLQYPHNNWRVDFSNVSPIGASVEFLVNRSQLILSVRHEVERSQFLERTACFLAFARSRAFASTRERWVDFDRRTLGFSQALPFVRVFAVALALRLLFSIGVTWCNNEETPWRSYRPACWFTNQLNRAALSGQPPVIFVPRLHHQFSPHRTPFLQSWLLPPWSVANPMSGHRCHERINMRAEPSAKERYARR